MNKIKYIAIWIVARMFYWAGDVVSRVPYIEGYLYPLYNWLMITSYWFDDLGDTKLWLPVLPTMNENNTMDIKETDHINPTGSK